MKTSLHAVTSLTTGLLAVACGSTTAELGPGDVADVGPRQQAALCPPEDGDRGLDLGQVVPDLALLTCDGTPMSLHDLCPRKAAYFFVYADW